MNNAGRSARAKGRELAREQMKKCWTAGCVFAGASLTIGVFTHLGLMSLPISVGFGMSAFMVSYRATDFSESQRWIQGAEGEERTARVLKPLVREGWAVFHDRTIPGTRANLDHLAIHPSGTFALNLDTKAWHAKNASVYLSGTRLMNGPWDKSQTVRTTTGESVKTSRALGVPVVSVVVLDGGRIDKGVHPSGIIRIATNPAFYVVTQGSLVDTLRRIPGIPDPYAVRRLSQLVETKMVPYVQKPTPKKGARTR